VGYGAENNQTKARRFIVNKTLIAGIVTLLFLILFSFRAEADSWVRCKHIPTGEVQMIRGMSCPTGWNPL